MTWAAPAVPSAKTAKPLLSLFSPSWVVASCISYRPSRRIRRLVCRRRFVRWGRIEQGGCQGGRPRRKLLKTCDLLRIPSAGTALETNPMYWVIARLHPRDHKTSFGGAQPSPTCRRAYSCGRKVGDRARASRSLAKLSGTGGNRSVENKLVEPKGVEPSTS